MQIIIILNSSRLVKHYIDKDALVAEIKRRKELVSDHILLGNDLMIGERNAYFNLLSFIDTLETKEVDLQSEIDRVWDNTSDFFLVEGWKEFEDIAKHFFELGMAANNKQSDAYIEGVKGSYTTITK